MAGKHKRVKERLFVTVMVCFMGTMAWAQTVIHLGNPSFEGLAHAGGLIQTNHINSVNPFNPIPEWTDCGFKTETPPDLHGPMTDFFGVRRLPQDGACFLGMVVRNNDTWERVSQKLSSPLEAGKCYSFRIYLSRDTLYKSATREESVLQSFTRPCVLRIHGGNGYCSAKEVLAETVPIENTEWRQYEFIFQPKQTWQFIELEAFYKTPVPFPYNGNVLLDNASAIVEVACPDRPQELAAPLPPDKVLAHVENEPVPVKKVETKPPTKVEPKSEVAAKPVEKARDERILKDLDADKIRKGQVIQIEKLFFNADESTIKISSHDVLDEVYDFLTQNPEVTVEIGGHTNGKPAHAYCDSLSTLRAESVANYLSTKGVDSDRIVAKGYGKRRPIASNRTPEGRRKNQRVEIKILSVNGEDG